ncbi:hypothetical protein [Bradyrhizobium sp. 186]|uniref:hypothetical protein n=1 Tax=Bradyrhizobium sp. 186 TaxID=2782654 RepID=UPI002001875D|nr:hypothetical protein [Bradyrhizobium sp. 186]
MDIETGLQLRHRGNGQTLARSRAAIALDFADIRVAGNAHNLQRCASGFSQATARSLAHTMRRGAWRQASVRRSLANPSRECFLAARSAVHGCDEGRAVLWGISNVPRQVAMHRNAKLNVALALLGSDNETVLGQVLPAKPHCIGAAEAGMQ